jgi:hypothetical protein
LKDEVVEFELSHCIRDCISGDHGRTEILNGDEHTAQSRLVVIPPVAIEVVELVASDRSNRGPAFVFQRRERSRARRKQKQSHQRFRATL